MKWLPVRGVAGRRYWHRTSDLFRVSRVHDALTGLLALAMVLDHPELSGRQRWGCHADRHADQRADTNPLISSGRAPGLAEGRSHHAVPGTLSSHSFRVIS